MNKTVLTTTLTGAAILFGLGLLLTWDTPEQVSTATQPADQLEAIAATPTELTLNHSAQPVSEANSSTTALSTTSVSTTPTAKIAQLSNALRAEFGAHINNARIQIRVLEKMIESLKELYGEHWQEQMEELIRLTFPDLVELLLPRFQNLLSYNEWAMEQRYQIANMSEPERRQLTWAKRAELFGDEAETIWQGQLRSERVQDVLAGLKDNPDLPLEQKIDHYVGQLNEIYQSEAAQMIGGHRQEVMDHFLEIDTIQGDLHNMPAPERREQLRKLRQAVGLDEDALGRWDELDAVRNQRWQNGKQYLEQRAKLQSSLQGNELESKLRELQNQVFGEEAEIIRNEETSGYFRYEGEQQFGLN